MVIDLQSVSPKIIPPLDAGFQPAALAAAAFDHEVSNVGVPLIIGLERDANKISRYETLVFPADHPKANLNYHHVERVIKFLLWQRGAFKIYLGGPKYIAEYIGGIYSPGGARQFDVKFMGDQVYEKPFQVIMCQPDEVPPGDDEGELIGRHLEGRRIGFDLGASDRKVSALIDGKVVFSEEKIWNPSAQADPNYHFNEIMDALRTASSYLDRVDAIGGSSAGIFINNRPMVASLYRNIPKDRFSEVHDIFLRIRDHFHVPMVVINDGDVAALAGAMSLEENGVLGIALGSSEAAGFVDKKGNILGWLNELSFAPVDYNPLAPVDEWSGDIGCGSTYFSQQCVFRLAPAAGIVLPPALSNADKLALAQEKLSAGHEGALKIWQTMGVYLGYGIAHYARFYDLKNVIIMGRCTSGEGGAVLLDGARKVMEMEFPKIIDRVNIQLPDEKNRRVGQAIAAASLPIIPG